MKKNQYIQPKVEMMVVAASAVMIPVSPGSEYDPQSQQQGNGAPERVVF